MELKVCCVTGNRPQKFPWNYGDVGSAASIRYHSDLKKLVENLVVKGGFNYFISGGALGVDQDFAEAVISLRDSSYPDIQLEVAIPCEGQDKLWAPADKKRYKNILDAADKFVVLSDHYFDGCMQKRNRFMVDRSSFVLAFWNGISEGGAYSTMSYAKRKGVRVWVYNLSDFSQRDL